MSTTDGPPDTCEDVDVWVEQGSSIHIKAITKEGDAVELSPDEARRLAERLLHLVARITMSDGRG